MSNTREFDDESFEAFLDALPDVEPPEHLKHSVFAAIDAGEHTSPTAQPIAEVVELPRRRTRGFFAAAAAAVLLMVGGIGVVQLRPQEDARIQAAGVEQMHAIMAADDLLTGNADASGATLDIVSSKEMGKSGAMVDGQPALADGMGAQVWAVASNGEVTSAGVIGQDPHDDVWMPFDGDATKVMITEEPMGGSAKPTGRMLAEVRLS
ncbi:anti-sigma factor [Corynebacterium striatum]|uniref:Anti-sigma factor n=1 Tax=Corynebacterium striatum TaxID=43770 RepID=A0AAQ1TU47_CORST|nr:anti-sigma factor [Corynebacterium striatum]EEI78079.1 hypothetical protein HMPREF0308_1599 [Corynebacterium striatum ATCC 6940]PIS67294.1 anti-sigma factor [Corynebacterium striatum]PXY13277.1 anti-sigma factor [Corynebacterium striatum]QQE52805.1 anti-sigma factor [Corynebacterium striatum]QQU77764.1 anti-sigma factor [Corynebacterium striatum]